MTEIIKGGAYKRADGSWVNAQGKPIPAPKGDVYVREEAPAVPQTAPDEFGAPPEPIATPKKTKKTGG